VRQATATFSRRRLSSQNLEGAPYKLQQLVNERYLIKDVVGLGPLGFVFRAHDREIDVEVALKVINPKLVQTSDERKQFAKIIKQARKLSHPNLVRVYEEGEDADRPFFTSQFLDGLTLRKIIDLRLQKGQFFNLREIEPIFTQIAAALDGAHKIGPHSDLKPDNVLVLPDLLKVTDFGLGLAMPRLPFVQAMKARRADRYLSPELAEGREVDQRTDVYSMGVVLGEMLSGLTPDGSIPELGRRNPDVPQQVEGIYRRSLNENPNARFKTAGEMWAELSDIIKRTQPPPLKSREDETTGVAAVTRVRPPTLGALQLQPRRASSEKPPPPVPELQQPPPPPPVSAEAEIPPDATQPVSPEQIRSALLSVGESAGGIQTNPDQPGDREETDIVQSGQYQDADGRFRLEPAKARDDEGKSGTAVWLFLLTVLGIGVGAGGGWWLLQRMKPKPIAPDTIVEVKKDPAEEARKAEEARRAEEARKADEAKKAEDLKKADELKAAQAKTDEAAVAAQKAEQDRLAAERAAALKAATTAAANPPKDGKTDKKVAQPEKAPAVVERAPEKQPEKAPDTKVAQPEKAPAETKVAAVTPAPRAGGDIACPEGMKQIPAGAFKMGTAKDDPMLGYDEKAISSVEVGAFCVDQFEFPNLRGKAPTTGVGWADAKRLCEGKGKRLCTEEEWEKACKGPGNARWPYGNVFDPDACNTEDAAGEGRAVSSAGRFNKCRSGYGVADLSGNVAEWTAEKVQKGGGSSKPDFAVRCSSRKLGAAAKAADVGFRCCLDPR
jgi:eukaryotic-like serine/threonine-protein kinase